MSEIRAAIVGHGNLGRGVEQALAQALDMHLVGIFSRRPAEDIQPLTAGVPVYALSDIDSHQDTIDVLILCGGSRSDLPEQGPALAGRFTTVDSFDTHARIPDYYAAMDEAARQGHNVSLVSIGWDPGLFSLNRLLAEAVLPQGTTHTFWGKGVSQGHSDAIRRIPGVRAAVQYTVPVPAALAQVRNGENPALSTRQKHTRECYVVLEEGANPQTVREAIVSMPYYFDEYDTQVNFISEAQLQADHKGMPHGGFVIRSGSTGAGTAQTCEFSLQLQSNPEFTASVMVAYARAAQRMKAQGLTGAYSVFDVAPALLSPRPAAELRQMLL